MEQSTESLGARMKFHNSYHHNQEYCYQYMNLIMWSIHTITDNIIPQASGQISAFGYGSVVNNGCWWYQTCLQVVGLVVLWKEV